MTITSDLSDSLQTAGTLESISVLRSFQSPDAVRSSANVWVRKGMARKTAMKSSAQSKAKLIPQGSKGSEMTGYNAKIDELREEEYPMLKSQTPFIPSLSAY